MMYASKFLTLTSLDWNGIDTCDMLLIFYVGQFTNQCTGCYWQINSWPGKLQADTKQICITIFIKLILALCKDLTVHVGAKVLSLNLFERLQRHR